jgi:hypothetical protein
VDLTDLVRARGLSRAKGLDEGSVATTDESEAGEKDGPSAFERFVRPFFQDLALWPVTLVVFAHLVLGTAVVLLGTFRARNAFAIAALALLLLASADALRHDIRRRRLGPLGGTVLATWAFGTLVAWAADHWGLV